MTEDYLQSWIATVLERHRDTVPRVIQTEGIYDQARGAYRLYAKVVLRIEPATEFTVSLPSGSQPVADDEMKIWMNEAIFGVLDILAFARPSPLFNVCLCLVRVEVHPVEPASRMAFRLAGRSAARRAVEVLYGVL